MKSHQATYVNEKCDTASDEISPSVLGEAVGNKDECQSKGAADDHPKGPESQSRLEEDWTPIRVKKKRSGGSLGGLNPTHIPSPFPPTLTQNQTLNQVSTLGKSAPLVSNISFPPKKSNFLSCNQFSNSAACLESASPGLNRFGCLAADMDQTVSAGPPAPPAPPVPSQPAHEPSEPSLEPSEPHSFSGLKSSPCSAGHTPYTLRRPSQFFSRGSLRSSPPCRVDLAIPPPGPTRAKSGARPSPIGPIAPPSSILGSNKTLFDQVRAAVRLGHAGTLGQPSSTVNNATSYPMLGDDLERGRSGRVLNDHEVETNMNGEELENSENYLIDNQNLTEDEFSGDEEHCRSGEDDVVENHHGDLRKEISLGSSWKESMNLERH
ncbi:hypothetical protein NE237_002447 [Protea cynaroides]|uniref:Uncharacterized protein n=1 Tax=Protea cynaroides TaxID=273540 RepID=A0A9Q0KVX9_9MAGN|nr:hypothetical protein NE237_002447 [Protea cynaroides]